MACKGKKYNRSGVSPTSVHESDAIQEAKPVELEDRVMTPLRRRVSYMYSYKYGPQFIWVGWDIS
jgi:hypothetical protein